MGLLGLVWFIGWTGYWLVWDERAQLLALDTIRALDVLPIFGEPMLRLFAADRTVPSLLFFVVFFLHMVLPLGIAAGLCLHLARLSRSPLLPDVPTFKELGVNWIDGAYRGVGVPRSTSPEARKKLSDMWLALNNDAEMKELAAKSGFELVNIGADQMDAFMKERIALYIEGAKRLGLGKK